MFVLFTRHKTIKITFIFNLLLIYLLSKTKNAQLAVLLHQDTSFNFVLILNI